MKRRDFSGTAVGLHLLVALIIFFLFISSWWMLGLPLPSAEYQFRAFPFQLHKNLGITLMVLLLGLLWIRLWKRPEPLGQLIDTVTLRWLTLLNHTLLYVVILLCCVSGYLSSSYSGWGTTLWWMVELPNWGYENEELNIFYSDIHLWTCWILLGLILLHIGGALYHAFRNDGVVRRMLHL